MKPKIMFVKYRPQLIFAVLALVVLGPLLKPGFALTLDMVFTPHIRLTDITTSSYLFYAALHVLNFLLPADLLQKIILFCILFFSGWGMYRLVLALPYKRDDASENLGAHFAGILYMVNPYTYSRFMAGQFAVLLGYCLLPFFMTSFLKLLMAPNWRQGMVLGILMALIGIVSIHTLGLIAILLGIALVLAAWRDRHSWSKLRTVIISTAVAFGVFVLLSSHWLVPLALGRSTTATAISGFTTNDDQAFATLGDGYAGRLANVVRLQGFWVEATQTFLMPQDHIVGWGIIVLVLWTLVTTGIYHSWRPGRRFLTLWLSLSAVVAILVAIGAFQNLLAYLPLLRGFREPHKFVGLVALAYALFAGQGAVVALERARRKSQVMWATALFVIAMLPIALTHTMLWGFAGQLQTVAYPASWTTMNQRLSSDRDNFQVLFLPWHQYMYFRFADRIIANPAASFFDKPTLVGNDLEFDNASSNFPNATKTIIGQQILPTAKSSTSLGRQLVPLGIKYVLLDKDNDYTAYAYLSHQTDLRLIAEDSSFKLYINDAFEEQYAPKS